MVRAVAGLAVVVALAGAAAAGAASSAKDLRLEVIATGTSQRLVKDMAPTQEPSQGDVLVGAERLRNAAAQLGRPKGALVGSSRVRAVFESASVALLTLVVRLPDGSLSCQGRANVGTEALLRVTGGTGAYRAAFGRCVVKRGPNETTRHVYLLRVPG